MTFKNDDTIDEQTEAAVDKKMQVAINKAINQRYIDELKDRIVKRTKLGQGADENGNTTRLPALSTGYKEQRTANRGNLDGTTRPARSNVTATGALLKSLTTVKVRMKGGIKWVIKVSENRTKTLTGGRSKVSNKELVGYLEAKGRKWLGFTKPQVNKITKEIRQILIKFLE